MDVDPQTSRDRRCLSSSPPSVPRERTISVLGDRWWPQTAKEEGDNISKTVYVTNGRNVLSAQMLEVSLRSRIGGPSQEGCVVNGQMTKASKQMSRPPHLRHVP